MALRNSRKFITCAVGVKGYFPGYLTFVCKKMGPVPIYYLLKLENKRGQTFIVYK